MRLLAALCGVLAFTSVWLWRRGPAVVALPVPTLIWVNSPPVTAGADVSPRAPALPGGRAAALFNAVARTVGGRGADRPAEEPSPDAPRKGRQQWLRDMLGRADGETDDAWQARVKPMIELALSRPRQRLEERRAEFEVAAELSPEQRAEMDQALGDVRGKLVALADQAVVAGDLTPYRRNTAGLVRFVAVAAEAADGLDARVRDLLSPEQLAILEQTGFDLTEYLGVTTPWENLHAPPPAPRP